MALPDSLLEVTGTQIVLANTGEYSPTGGQPARTDQIDLGALATTTFRQSAKFDLGANRETLFKVTAYIEFHSAPTAGQEVRIYVGFSSSATAGNDNPANLSGSDAAYQGYGGDVASAQEAVKQLDLVGVLITAADADIQIAEAGHFFARDRYAMIVVENGTGTTIANTDAIETAIAITPVKLQVQD